MADYRIEKVAPENFSMLIPLMKDCFGMTVNIDYFKWKYLQNPAGNFIGFVAIENASNEVAAYYGVIPQKFWIMGKEQTIYQSCDTMTHSKHRRKGLFQQLALHCYNDIKLHHTFFIIGFGGGQSTPGFIKFGWKEIFKFRYYFKPKILCKINSIGKILTNNIAEVVDTTALQALLNDVDGEAKNFSSKNLAHLKWRITNPNHQYKVISFCKNNVPEGYTIYYIESQKVFLFDFYFKTKTAEKNLLKYLSKAVVENDLKGIVAFCQEDGKQSKILKTNFYCTNPFSQGPLCERVPFIIFANEKTMEDCKNAASWQVNAYDHDAL